ncbi:S-layer homology domain-containing protein, partial [Planococcus sp. SIMBA_143]
RKGPGTNYPVIRSLKEGQGYYVYEIKDGWYNLGGDQWASNSDCKYLDYKPHVVDDVTGHWAESSIIKAKEKGVITGHSDGSFGPNEPVTRGQLAVI